LPSDDSSSASHSVGSNGDFKPRRRRARKKNKKNTQAQKNEELLSLEEQAQYLALDCEMVDVGHNGNRSSVARVTLVDWNGKVVMDAFVKQSQEVTDYRTFVSGITEADLENAELTLTECQTRVEEWLDGKVLVGHALKNDLRALGITHPWVMTRDTAKYEPFMQVRFNDGVLWPRKLKDLLSEKVKREIQTPGKPHSPIEDALAAMDLYRTVRRKWEKAMDYKIKKTLEMTKAVQQQQQAE
jgi:RNA exonuclease 4